MAKPVRFEYLDHWLKRGAVRVLDVGCADHSPRKTKEYYPECHYYGIDRTTAGNLDKQDLECMERFFLIDLSTVSALDVVPDDFFDCLILSHVIEHLSDGDEVVAQILRKLKRGGVIYIETPSLRSAHLPRGSLRLNFYDDPSHVKLYDPTLVRQLLARNGCTVLKSGTRCSLKRIALMPALAVGTLIFGKPVTGGLVWDLVGFASYTVAQKR